MDEELGVKVTRLRRRLSVEAEGAQSPATPSTPTKKRATRLAKPALELIDENDKNTVTENVPKRATRKSIARDTLEPVEEKTVTPSRRSARIRSNTSLVVEATQNVVDSPRAKRATRRNSQLGSDTESTTTPARQNRRTRRDSTSSIEKLAVTNTAAEKVTVQVAEVITEEPEKEATSDSKVENSNNRSPTLRKSPRLNKKGRKSIDEAVKDISERLEQKETTLSNTSKSADNILPSQNEPATTTNDKSNNNVESAEYGKENISLTTTNLINEMVHNPRRVSVFNKTASAIEGLDDEKTKRQRTKSWSTVTSHQPTEDVNKKSLTSGDNLIKKEFDVNSPNKSINKLALIVNSSIENKENIHILKSVDIHDVSDTLKVLGKAPSNDIQAMVFIEDSDSNSGSIGKLTIDLQNDGNEQQTDGGDQCVPVVKQPTPKRTQSESFSVEPMDIDESIPENVTINDFSDKANSSREEDKVLDSKRKSSTSAEKSADVNEASTKSIKVSSNNLLQGSNNSTRKSSISSEQNNDSTDALRLNRSSLSDKSNRTSISKEVENGKNQNESNVAKSTTQSSLSKIETETDKRKSSVSSQVDDHETSNESKTQNLEKTSNENKSTLVLSQLKDLSTNEITNASKSPNDSNLELSKSVNIASKSTEKRNLSLNYMTSTPLQQQSLQKVAKPINTSIFSPAETKNTSNANKTKSPKKKIIDVSHDSDSSSDEDSMEKSNMIDDEAAEASDNYESGDSRSDEEKQYEKDHEILEKGETLESEHEFSNDSDYEKDSFIVSSDEEDDDLLSGSGDDLSLSDNELKMTAKSKKKFDNRKQKEQKKASKEMYESRHNLNESDKSSKSKTKKPKRQRLDSSILESENAEDSQPKKKLRIDSSQDVSLNNTEADESIRVMKKKVKRLSESVCEGNAEDNEKEITVYNQSIAEQSDPLSVSVKLEPKTPQKDSSMSAVLISDNIEEVQIDSNTSLIKSNETSDPLQGTLVEEHEQSNSDISENMEIKENYDSMLEILNKNNNKPKKAKILDASLDAKLNKNKKDTVKEPIIVDQLNLTQVRKSKKNKGKVDKEVSVLKNDEGDISDSIDMRLLFPEDSNDSETNGSKFKSDKQNVEPADEFIPLKRSEAKTNIRESMDISTSQHESELNVSKKKNKKRKSSDYSAEAISANEPEDANVSFFIDTKGAYADVETSMQTSAKKNKKKHKHNLSVENSTQHMEDNETVAEISGSQTALVKVSQMNNKKKKKKNKSFDVSNTGVEYVEPSSEASFKNKNDDKSDITATEETPTNTSVKSDKKKKKKNKSFDVSETGPDAIGTTSEVAFKTPEEALQNVSLKSDKKKKKNKSFDVSEIADGTGSEETPVNVSLKSDKKKNKKNKSFDVSEMVDGTAPEETTVNISLKSDKKKMKNKSFDVSEIVDGPEETTVNVSFNSDKKNKLLDASENVDDTCPEETAVDVSFNSDKRKKKKKEKSLDSSVLLEIAGPEETAVDVSFNSDKRKKKKKEKSLDSSVLLEIAASEEITDIPTNSGKKKNKKNRSLEIPQTVEITVSEEVAENDSQKKDKKKKKNKAHDASQIVDNTGEESDEAPLEVSFKSEKYNLHNDGPVTDETALPGSSKNKFKKRKKNKKVAQSQTGTTKVNTQEKVNPQETVNTQENEVISMKRKREKISALSTNAADGETNILLSKGQKKRKTTQSESDKDQTEENTRKQSKKRKAIDDNSGQKKSKMFKENSFDNIHVPRLPESVVKQLDDQPPRETKNQKKVKAISTVPFQVEEAKRKNKPSNYLEQSIYLNDSPVKQKQKLSIKNPKVLPFTPTVITSGKGYTSQFRINVLPQETQFVAQASDVTNFKNEYLSNQRIKKLGTFERFKRQRNHKISKF